MDSFSESNELSSSSSEFNMTSPISSISQTLGNDDNVYTRERVELCSVCLSPLQLFADRSVVETKCKVRDL